MQEIIIEKPYQFVPPHRGQAIPALLQRLRVVDHYLKRREGIHSHELRGIEHLKESLRQGAAILLTPNHCRYADPLTMAWLLRPLGVYPYAMASWHLFHHHPLQSLAIRLCGGFSVNREGVDRQALDMAVNTLIEGKRPLILFPEGTVFAATIGCNRCSMALPLSPGRRPGGEPDGKPRRFCIPLPSSICFKATSSGPCGRWWNGSKAGSAGTCPPPATDDRPRTAIVRCLFVAAGVGAYRPG